MFFSASNKILSLEANLVRSPTNTLLGVRGRQRGHIARGQTQLSSQLSINLQQTLVFSLQVQSELATSGTRQTRTLPVFDRFVLSPREEFAHGFHVREANHVDIKLEEADAEHSRLAVLILFELLTTTLLAAISEQGCLFLELVDDVLFIAAVSRAHVADTPGQVCQQLCVLAQLGSLAAKATARCFLWQLGFSSDLLHEFDFFLRLQN